MRIWKWCTAFVESAAVEQLQGEIADLRERIIPSLERKIKVMEAENATMAAALARDRKRVEAETAVYAQRIAETGN